jgi:hypothetical protein
MKTFITQAWHKMTAVITLALFSVVSFAQDKGVDIDVNVKKENWYQQPWVWIVGGAVFILLLVALMRGGGSKSEA